MIVRITGGVGNQMFQYAMKLKLDMLNGKNNRIDIRFYDDVNVHNGYELNSVFGIDAELYDGEIDSFSNEFSILYKLCFKFGIRFLKSKNRMTEIRIGFDKKVFNYKKNNDYIDGYWQSEDYFKDIEENVRNTFRFPQFTEEKNINLVGQLQNYNSVSIHVRRGDYLGVSRFASLGNTLYYQKAIKYITEHIKNPLFVVVSDDIRWCKENLNLPQNSIYVDWNNKEKSYRDMQIMSNCKHNIIANSSFSWWGAWLNENANKIVIAPEHFFNGIIEDDSHIIPTEWIKIKG